MEDNLNNQKFLTRDAIHRYKKGVITLDQLVKRLESISITSSDTKLSKIIDEAVFIIEQINAYQIEYKIELSKRNHKDIDEHLSKIMNYINVI